MKKIDKYIIIILLFLPFVQLNAQTTFKNNIKIEQVQAEKQGDNVKIDMDINLNELTMRRADMIILTPVVRSADKTHFKRFAPIVLAGPFRDKKLPRDIDFEGFRFEQEPQQIVRRVNKRPQSIPVTLNMPYENWIRNGELVLLETKSGCDLNVKTDDEYTVFMPVLPPLVEPVYSLSYVTPPVEEVKQRSETYTARINFEVGKSVLLRNFKNNAQVLDDVDKIVNEIRNDANLTVNEFRVVGFASPEGNEQSNMKLSENRARAFVSYMRDRYNIPTGSIKVDWKGEDWEGLRKVVNESNISDKSQILGAIDESNVQQRKNKMKQLSSYQMLLRDYYPPLRRNEYTIAYVARNFTIDEAKQLIHSKPQHLSLNEMFLVANTYPSTSKEFKEVFDIAVRLYPDNPVAQLNTAALEIENGATDAAIGRLQNINLPEAWNNLGIAYAKKGDFQKAEEYFKRASQSGNSVAMKNAEQLSQWLMNR